MPILTRIAAAACAPLLALSATSAVAQSAAPLKNDVVTRVDAMYPWLDTIYKDLHAHPEIAFQEVRTAGKLAAEMRKLGFTVTEKVGKTGIVAVLKNGAG
ncbi:MAG: amidohydrolase, partial [Oxalobacteraceae bacterium]